MAWLADSLDWRLANCSPNDSLSGVFRGSWLGLVDRLTRLYGLGWRPRSSDEKVAAESPTKAPLGQPQLKSLMGCLLEVRYSNSGHLLGQRVG
jgi:hypothetical protein